MWQVIIIIIIIIIRTAQTIAIHLHVFNIHIHTRQFGTQLHNNNNNNNNNNNVCCCFPGVTTHCGCIFTAQQRVFAPSFSRFLDHTQRRATVCRIPLDEWSIRRRVFYLTTHSIHNRQISMPPVGFEPTISTGERRKTYALDRAATGTSK